MPDIGPYKIIALICDGGQALSYRAMHVGLEREVFLKVLPAGGPNWHERRARFEREAKALARIDHPAVVRVYDFGEADGKLYLASEYLTGPDLASRIAEGAVPWDELKPIALILLEGLEALHVAGIVHRDIKPSNVLLSTKGPKLADLGLARLIQHPSVTQSDTLVGTPAYMDPETLRGGAADARADLFSLGATLYEALTGRRAFPGETFQEVVRALLETDPLKSLPPDTSADAQRFLAALLQKRSERRPPTVAGAKQVLLSGHATPVHSRTFRRRVSLWGPIAAAAVGLFIIFSEFGRPDLEESTALMPIRLSEPPQDSVVIPATGTQTMGRLEAPPKESSPAISLEASSSPPPTRPASVAAASSRDTTLDSTPAVSPSPPAFLWVATVPWAEVSIDGAVIDTTPLSSPLSLPPGRHEVTLKHLAFPAIASAVDLRPGAQESLFVSLADSLGFLHVQTDPWATLSVDGIPAGTTPLTAPIALHPGAHEIVAENPFFPRRVEQVTLARCETLTAAIDLRNAPER